MQRAIHILMISLISMVLLSFPYFLLAVVLSRLGLDFVLRRLQPWFAPETWDDQSTLSSALRGVA